MAHCARSGQSIKLAAEWQELALLGPLLRLWQSLTPSLPNFAQLAASMQTLAAAQSPLDACLASEVAFAQGLVSTVAAGLGGLAEVTLGSATLEPRLQVKHSIMTSA